MSLNSQSNHEIINPDDGAPLDALGRCANDNGDHYPFNVSTNAGGTLEFCRAGQGGVDQNAAQHLRLLADALGSPQILVCPGDASRKAAVDFKSLQTTNISYQLRTGPTVDESHPQEILVRCPIHGSTLRTDGSIQDGRRQPEQRAGGAPRLLGQGLEAANQVFPVNEVNDLEALGPQTEEQPIV